VHERQAAAVTTSLRVSVARSARRLWKLWTARPSSVRPRGLFGLGGRRACCFGDDAGTLCDGGGAIVVIIEHRRQPGAQAPFDVIAEHAQEHMGADASAEPVVERPDLQIDRLQRAECGGIT
jgi:hypothetical protein